MKLATFFPYRNDARKILIPYLNHLTEEQWYARHPDHPNSIAWIMEHIARSEDEWINVIALKEECRLQCVLDQPQQILQAYIDIRDHTDLKLSSMEYDEHEPALQLPSYSDGWEPPSLPTLRWVFHHVFDHEAYHIGQIGVIARLNGFDGPLF
ncbi:damage-inducible protein DinB [Paenibacillus ihbetae]|uniref:Damage-inducible protein DinB n=1 Tax=Paenibacillus ihbetae TaxID=1870820 RepID=A0A1B2E8D6_9BACL|nr:DinB family protein [Paenibacillus ihbetae]ANY76211.1 damage-inducible protein DinB [Paenibacillus ihbetae]